MRGIVLNIPVRDNRWQPKDPAICPSAGGEGHFSGFPPSPHSFIYSALEGPQTFKWHCGGIRGLPQEGKLPNKPFPPLCTKKEFHACRMDFETPSSNVSKWASCLNLVSLFLNTTSHCLPHIVTVHELFQITWHKRIIVFITDWGILDIFPVFQQVLLGSICLSICVQSCPPFFPLLITKRGRKNKPRWQLLLKHGQMCHWCPCPQLFNQYCGIMFTFSGDTCG